MKCPECGSDVSHFLWDGDVYTCLVCEEVVSGEVQPEGTEEEVEVLELQ